MLNCTSFFNCFLGNIASFKAFFSLDEGCKKVYKYLNLVSIYKRGDMKRW